MPYYYIIADYDPLTIKHFAHIIIATLFCILFLKLSLLKPANRVAHNVNVQPIKRDQQRGKRDYIASISALLCRQ